MNATADYPQVAAAARIAIGNARIAAARSLRTGRQDDRRIADDLARRANVAIETRDALWVSLSPAERAAIRLP